MSSIQLTEDEKRNLLWEQSDHFEILTGNISFTSRRQFKRVQTENAQVITEVQFFFESSDPKWGTKEWTMCMDANIQNGPALLVTYNRDNTACAWGIVSMVNRAWTHCLPVDSIDLAQGSTLMKEMNKKFGAGMLGAAGIATAATLLTGGAATFALAIPSVRKKLGSMTGMDNYKKRAEEIGSTARAFMFRISRNAEQYWPNEQSGGKL